LEIIRLNEVILVIRLKFVTKAHVMTTKLGSRKIQKPSQSRVMVLLFQTCFGSLNAVFAKFMLLQTSGAQFIRLRSLSWWRSLETNYRIISYQFGFSQSDKTPEREEQAEMGY